jgi:hypothetical protein
VDLTRYATGVRTLRNFVVARHGGAYNRAGLKYIAEVKDSSKAVRLIPFVFNDDQTYIMEFGDQYIRFIRNGAQVLDGAVPYEISTPYLEADLPDLQFVQSADVVTIVHRDYAPRDLSRTGHTSWSLNTILFRTPFPPTDLLVSGTTGSDTFSYRVTAVTAAGEESTYGRKTKASIRAASLAYPHTISWTAPAAGTGTVAVEYNVYLEVNGVAGFIGVTPDTSFVNNGITPDLTDTPPVVVDPTQGGVGYYPGTVAYYQQRLLLANMTNYPERIYFSRPGFYKNFSYSVPSLDTDGMDFDLVGRQVNAIQHLLDVGRLIIFTSGGEWVAKGDATGSVTPSQPNFVQQTYHGASALRPIIVGKDALYVQSRSSIVRDLLYDYETDGYQGSDLTVFSSHLVDGYTLQDWTYQQTPNSILWMVRDDGTLLGLTYMREHQILGWHRHDTEGTFENACAIPETGEDFLYVVVNRTINGSTKRYIERMESRSVTEDTIADAVFLDSFLSYDGTNATATTMTLSLGAGGWGWPDELTLTASASFFVVGDVGNAIHMRDSTGDEVRCEITAYTSDKIVTVRPHKDVPASLQATAVTTWGKAVDNLSNLDHLEGEDVAVFADAGVVANPLNGSMDTITVASGAITLTKPKEKIHVGLPYLSDLLTLDIDTTQGETIMDKEKLLTHVTLFVEASRGIWAGQDAPSDDATNPVEGLREVKVRQFEPPGEPPALRTGKEKVHFPGSWNTHGRVFIRQVDPVPMTILAIAPAGFLPT